MLYFGVMRNGQGVLTSTALCRFRAVKGPRGGSNLRADPLRHGPVVVCESTLAHSCASL